MQERAETAPGGLLDTAEAAGWNRRIAASTLMFLAAQNVSAAAGTSGGR
jgi:hypothetical protein